MTDNQPANLDEQIDEILNDVWELGYSSRSHLGEPDFNEDTENIDQAKAAIQQLLVAERIDELKRFCNSDGDYCISDRIAALQSQLTDGESAWLAPK